MDLPGGREIHHCPGLLGLYRRGIFVVGGFWSLRVFDPGDSADRIAENLEMGISSLGRKIEELSCDV
jgi:hypothetical protein